MTEHAAASGKISTTSSAPIGSRVAAPIPTVERPLPRLPAAIWVIGLACVGVAIMASGALVLKHFTGVALPGCRVGSACDRLGQSIFGRILFPQGMAQWLGFAKWPVSSLGFAFFVAVCAAWLAGLRWIAPGLKWMVRFGALFSLVYVVIIFVKREWCPYCLYSHAANFGLLISMEVGLMLSKRSGSVVVAHAAGGRSSARSGRAGVASLAAFALAFSGATGVLGMKERGLAVAAAAELRESQEKMLAAERERAERAAAEAAARAAQPEGHDFGPNGFTGRYRLGPEKAVVRIVIFGAYTCKFCKQMEQQALALQAANPDKVSFCFKHYPMCWICNKNTKEADTEPVHRNACWAARCAEACAIVAGANAELEGKDRWTAANEAFWKAHHWLYDIEGQFDDKALMDGLKAQGFDADKVTSIMDKPAADRPVVADIEEGHALGLFQTPMIFINGVELKGWQVPGSLQSTVNRFLTANPPIAAADSKNDRPALAREKAVADWEEQAKLVFMADTTARTIGDAKAPVEVLIFGDFQEPNTARADAIVRSWIYAPEAGGLAKEAASARPVKYTFRHFPGDKSCNTKLPRNIFPQGCLASRSAEAAGLLGGEAGYWKMHDWLMKNQSGFGYDAARRAARTLGLEPDRFVASLEDARVAQAIQNDIDAAEAVRVDQIPKIYIQGKWVRTWTREGDNVLERIVDKVAKEAGAK